MMFWFKVLIVLCMLATANATVFSLLVFWGLPHVVSVAISAVVGYFVVGLLQAFTRFSIEGDPC
jgi:hypothetical protein